jgi:hypothetical protein
VFNSRMIDDWSYYCQWARGKLLHRIAIMRSSAKILTTEGELLCTFSLARE